MSLKVRTVLVAALLAAATGSAAAADYSFYGDASLAFFFGGDRLSAAALLETSVSHTLSFDWGEARLRHRAALGADLTEAFGGSEGETDAMPSLIHTIEQADILWHPDPRVTLQVGRQQLGWGAGYAFSPADALHPNGRAGEAAAGFDGASVTWAFSPDWTASGALRLDAAAGADPETLWWEELLVGGIASGYVEGLELFFSCFWKPRSVLRPGLGLTLEAAGTIITLEGAGDFLHDPGPYAGLGIQPPEPGTPGWTFSVGLERMLYGDPLTVLFRLEYCHAGTGLEGNDRETAYQAMLTLLQGNLPEGSGFLAGGMEMVLVPLGRHYLFGMAGLDIGERASTGHALLVNLEALSAVVSHSFSWMASPAIELSVEGSWVAGGRGASEPALLAVLGLGWGAGFRARIFY